jgi:5-methylcytosine-specific restriction endonuclease McrA
LTDKWTGFCNSCKGSDITETIFTEANRKANAYGERRCNNCNKHLGFITTPKNMDKRTDDNQKWRKEWHEKGEFVCAMCGIRESDLRIAWECDHIVPLDEGGLDEFGNTMMICMTDHNEKTSKWKRTARWRKLVAEIYEQSGFDPKIGDAISRGEKTARKVAATPTPCPF